MNARILSRWRRFAACFAALAMLCAGAAVFSARAAVVVGSIEDVTSQPYGGLFNSIQFNPLSTPQAVGTNTIWSVPRTARVVAGQFSVSLVGGFYDAGLLPLSPTDKKIRIFVDPDSTNVLQFNDCAFLATNTSFYFVANPLALLASTQYVIAAVSPLASKAQLAAASNSLFSAIPPSAQFWRKEELAPGTNTTFRTNSGTVYIDTQATGGGSGTVPDGVLTNGQDGVALSGAFTGTLAGRARYATEADYTYEASTAAHAVTADFADTVNPGISNRWKLDATNAATAVGVGILGTLQAGTPNTMNGAGLMQWSVNWNALDPLTQSYINSLANTNSGGTNGITSINNLSGTNVGLVLPAVSETQPGNIVTALAMGFATNRVTTNLQALVQATTNGLDDRLIKTNNSLVALIGLSTVTSNQLWSATNRVASYFQTNKQPASLNLSNWATLDPATSLVLWSNSIYWMAYSNRLYNLVTNFAVVDTNGYPVFWATNGGMALSPSLLASNGATMMLLALDTNSSMVGIPQGYAGIKNLAVTDNLLVNGLAVTGGGGGGAVTGGSLTNGASSINPVIVARPSGLDAATGSVQTNLFISGATGTNSVANGLYSLKYISGSPDSGGVVLWTNAADPHIVIWYDLFVGHGEAFPLYVSNVLSTASWMFTSYGPSFTAGTPDLLDSSIPGAPQASLWIATNMTTTGWALSGISTGNFVGTFSGSVGSLTASNITSQVYKGSAATLKNHPVDSKSTGTLLPKPYVWLTSSDASAVPQFSSSEMAFTNMVLQLQTNAWLIALKSLGITPLIEVDTEWTDIGRGRDYSGNFYVNPTNFPSGISNLASVAHAGGCGLSLGVYFYDIWIPGSFMWNAQGGIAYVPMTVDSIGKDILWFYEQGVDNLRFQDMDIGDINDDLWGNYYGPALRLFGNAMLYPKNGRTFQFWGFRPMSLSALYPELPVAPDLWSTVNAPLWDNASATPWSRPTWGDGFVNQMRWQYTNYMPLVSEGHYTTLMWGIATYTPYKLYMSADAIFTANMEMMPEANWKSGTNGGVNIFRSVPIMNEFANTNIYIIQQDLGGNPGWKPLLALDDGTHSVWVKPLSQRRQAVLVINQATTNATVTATFDRMGLQFGDSYTPFDVWGGTNLSGPLTSTLTVTVPAKADWVNWLGQTYTSVPGFALYILQPSNIVAAAASVMASNIVGVLPAGTVAANSMTNGLALGTDGTSRYWTNNLAGVSIGGNAATATALTGARANTNLALLNGTNTFSGTNVFTGLVTVSNVLTIAQPDVNSGFRVNSGSAYVVATNGNFKTSGTINSGAAMVSGSSISSGSFITLANTSDLNWNAYGAPVLHPVNGDLVLKGYSVTTHTNSLFISGSVIATNGVVNLGTGWTGTTNSAAPSNTATPVAWANYTNSTGGVFKMPLYQ